MSKIDLSDNLKLTVPTNVQELIPEVVLGKVKESPNKIKPIELVGETDFSIGGDAVKITPSGSLAYSAQFFNEADDTDEDAIYKFDPNEKNYAIKHTIAANAQLVAAGAVSPVDLSLSTDGSIKLAFYQRVDGEANGLNSLAEGIERFVHTLSLDAIEGLADGEISRYTTGHSTKFVASISATQFLGLASADQVASLALGSNAVLELVEPPEFSFEIAYGGGFDLEVKRSGDVWHFEISDSEQKSLTFGAKAKLMGKPDVADKLKGLLPGETPDRVIDELVSRAEKLLSANFTYQIAFKRRETEHLEFSIQMADRATLQEDYPRLIGGYIAEVFQKIEAGVIAGFDANYKNEIEKSYKVSGKVGFSIFDFIEAKLENSVENKWLETKGKKQGENTERTAYTLTNLGKVKESIDLFGLPFKYEFGGSMTAVTRAGEMPRAHTPQDFLFNMKYYWKRVRDNVNAGTLKQMLELAKDNLCIPSSFTLSEADRDSILALQGEVTFQSNCEITHEGFLKLLKLTEKELEAGRVLGRIGHAARRNNGGRGASTGSMNPVNYEAVIRNWMQIQDLYKDTPELNDSFIKGFRKLDNFLWQQSDDSKEVFEHFYEVIRGKVPDAHVKYNMVISGENADGQKVDFILSERVDIDLEKDKAERKAKPVARPTFRGRRH